MQERLSLKLPPGIFRNGTKYQSRGRWYDASLVRCFESSVRPIGGWVELPATGDTNDSYIPHTFFDEFVGPADATLASHAPDTSGYTWTDADSAFEMNGSGALRNALSDGAVHVAYINEDVFTPSVGSEFWFETTLGAVGAFNSGLGMVFLKSTTTGEEYWIRLYPAPHSGNTGWDFSIVFNSLSSGGSDQPVYSNIFATTPNLAVGSWRFGVTIASTTSVVAWYEPAGGGSRTTLATWTGNSSTLPNRVDADHCQIGLIAEMESGGPVNWLNFVAGGSTATSSTVTLLGVPRALVGWRGNDGNQLLAFGTNRRLYAQTTGGLYDITPGGFVEGSADPSYGNGGYGDGAYGAYLYGVPDPAQETVQPPAMWHLDTFGEYLVACCSPNDGLLYYWDKVPTTNAQLMSGSPTNCTGIVVTPERFVVALGAGGESRRVEWASQETLDTWTPASTNTAGGFDLEGVGIIVAGRRSKGETLIWTTDDLHSMRYIGGTLVYAFEKIGSKCGLVSPGAVTLIDTKAVWMGPRQFFLYDGYVKPVPCEVSDYVFSDFNWASAGKVTSMSLSAFGEIWWFYPSGASSENDRYVVWNYRENHWMIGSLARTCGTDAGAVAFPVMCAADGKVYEHEKAQTRVGTPYIESGPVEIGDGTAVMHVSQLVPDERTLGDARFYLYASFEPGGTETRYGPFTISELTDVRITGRWARIRAEEVNQVDWRLGHVRLVASVAGRR